MKTSKKLGVGAAAENCRLLVLNFLVTVVTDTMYLCLFKVIFDPFYYMGFITIFLHRLGEYVPFFPSILSRVSGT